MVREYDARRKYIVGRLNDIPGVECGMPRGAFYVFPDVRGVLARPGGPATALALSERLLDEAHVAVVPGEAFEAPGFLRLSYATSMDRIEEGLNRIDPGARPARRTRLTDTAGAAGRRPVGVPIHLGSCATDLSKPTKE